jgi:hypothetical protein
MSEVDNFLAHYGVKGMRWGHRKPDDSGGAAPKKRSRKELRAVNKAGREKFNQDRADKVLGAALKKGDGVLIKTHMPYDQYPTIMSGKEFTTYLSRGGAFDIRMTDIYATKDEKAGTYVLNDQPTERYKKVKA